MRYKISTFHNSSQQRVMSFQQWLQELILLMFGYHLEWNGMGWYAYRGTVAACRCIGRTKTCCSYG